LQEANLKIVKHLKNHFPTALRMLLTENSNHQNLSIFENFQNILHNMVLRRGSG